MPSPAFRAFVAPAVPGAALWRTALGIVLVVALYLAATLAAFATITALAGAEAAYTLGLRLMRPDAPGPTLFLLATFVGMAAAPMAVVALLHGRGPGTLFGRAPVVLRDFVVAVAVVGGFYALSIAVWSAAYDARPNLPVETWLTLLPLTLMGLLVQTGAEELVFRGYMTQQLAARFRSRLAWLVLPSLVFGLVHYAPAISGGNVWILVAGAALFGIYAADLTAASGSIGAAWGFHFANNLFALAILATDGTITGLALYLTPYGADVEGLSRLALLGDYLMLTASWGLCRLAVRR